MISIIIPSRNEQFLPNTINELLTKCEGQIEIIAILDGYYIDLPKDDRLKIIHFGKSKGLRAGINAGVSIAKGEYIMKIDGHCMVDQGYDVKLVADCEKNWIVIPRRKRLDAENWCIADVGKPDVDYEYLSYPDNPKDFGGPGLNGKIWTQRALDRKDKLIDENMSFQGSCWFMFKDYFYELELMDEANYGTFWNEAQELGMKCWLSGGKVMTNKKTWYAHLHKGKKHGRGYHLDTKQLFIGSSQTKKWLTDSAWSKQTKPFKWLIEHFSPVPTWPQKPNRKDLARLFKGVGVEVGVERAWFAKTICKLNPKTKLFCIDPWQFYKGYREHVSQERLDEFYAESKQRMAGFNCEIIRGFSLDVVNQFEDNSLDFVYIDANHEYEYVKKDIEAWYNKVKVGGILSGHDYNTNGVKRAVDERFNNVTIYDGDKSPSWKIIK